MIYCSKKEIGFHALHVLSPWSHVIKAKCQWRKNIEHVSTDKLRVLEIEQKRIVYI